MILKTYVVAASYDAFRAWIAHGERDASRYLYISEPSQIMGLRLPADRFKFLPGAHTHPNYTGLVARITVATSKAGA